MIQKRNLGEQWIRLVVGGTLAAGAGKDFDYAEFDFVIENIYSQMNTAGVTGSTVIDVNIDGSTIFDAAGKITYGATVNPTYAGILAALRTGAKGAKFSLDVDSIHSGTAPIGLVVMIQLKQRSTRKTVSNLAPASL